MHIKSKVFRVYRAIIDAVIGGKAAKIQVIYPEALQIVTKPGFGLLVILKECRIGINSRVQPF